MDNRFPCNYDGVYYKSRKQFCKEYAGKIGMRDRGLEDRFTKYPDLSIEEIISMEKQRNNDNRFPCNYDGIYYKSRKQFCNEYASKIGISAGGLEDRFVRNRDLSIEEIISMERQGNDNRFPCNYDGVYYKYRNHFCKEYASKIGMTVDGLRNRFIAHPNLSIEEIVSIEAQDKDKDDRFPCNYDGIYYKSRTQFCKEYANKIGISASGLSYRFKCYPDLSIEEIISIEVGDKRFPCNYDGIYYKSRKQFCNEYASKIGMSASGLNDRFKIHPDLSIEEIISMKVGDNRFPCNYDGIYYKNRTQFCKEYASKIGMTDIGLRHRFDKYPDLSIDFIVGKYPILKSLISNIPSSQSIPDINVIEEVLPDLFKCEETVNGEVIGTLRTKDQIFTMWKERKCGYWEFNE